MSTERGDSGLCVVRSGTRESVVQLARVEAGGLTELYLRIRPPREKGDIDSQARSIYDALFGALGAQGAEPEDVITEKVFFSDVDRHFFHLDAIRKEAYADTIEKVGCGPATNFLHQPPCNPGRLCELEAYVVFPNSGDRVEIDCIEDLPGLASGKVVSHGGYRHVYLMNFTGNGGPENSLGFTEQAHQMYDRALASLQRAGASFHDVIRTWIYIADIERDYEALNVVRTSIHEGQGLERIPASTGIQGATFPWARGCTMDVYALLADRPVQIDMLHSPTMNEAPAYGSSFSRGMALTINGRTVIYVSGTASIDTEGRILHVGDLEGQVHRMIENVEALLGTRGATFDDVVSAITYLKRPEYLDTFYRIWDERGLLGDIPNTVSMADVCRPEWLCEIEVIAVSPEDRG